MHQTTPKRSRTPSQPIVATSPIRLVHAFWQFSRPHTIIGTSLSVLGLYLLAAAETGQAPSLNGVPPITFDQSLLSITLTLLACLCGNVYIVGLNQLEDIAIDRINKPHLPLASGEFSLRQARLIVGLTGVASLLLAIVQGPYLLGMVGLSLAIGTAYSLPPIRLKRFPFWASACIFTVRGVIVNLGLFLHFNQQLGGNTLIPPSVWVLTLFILGFTLAIALLKDIPDILGDRQYNIQTFTLRLGADAVFQIARILLTLCYVGVILAVSSGFLSRPIVPLILGHLVLLGALWLRSLSVNVQDQANISRFYQFVWKLFFLEYLIFPILCAIY